MQTKHTKMIERDLGRFVDLLRPMGVVRGIRSDRIHGFWSLVENFFARWGHVRVRFANFQSVVLRLIKMGNRKHIAVRFCVEIYVVKGIDDWKVNQYCVVHPARRHCVNFSREKICIWEKRSTQGY